MPELSGIDVSHYQNENTQPKKIDWAQVKASGVQFCIIKASDNKSADAFYGANHKGTSDAGILSGAYHFMRITASAADQAKAFLKSAKLDVGSLLPSLDVEVLPKSSDGRKAFLDKISAWLDIVSHEIGNKKPFIYTRKSIWDFLTKQKAFGEYPLWVANYGVAKPKLPASWSEYVIWQYSEKGSVPGIKKNVDLNALAGIFSELKSKYCI